MVSQVDAIIVMGAGVLECVVNQPQDANKRYACTVWCALNASNGA